MDRTKACSRCGETKPLESFNRFTRSPDGRQAWCRACKKQAYHSKYAANQRKRRYGVSDAAYQKALRKQGGTCAICGEPCASGNRLAVDHNHDTGQIRGLLCSSCNVGLGKFRDDERLLWRAIDYLRNPPWRSE